MTRFTFLIFFISALGVSSTECSDETCQFADGDDSALISLRASVKRHAAAKQCRWHEEGTDTCCDPQTGGRCPTPGGTVACPDCGTNSCACPTAPEPPAEPTPEPAPAPTPANNGGRVCNPPPEGNDICCNPSDGGRCPIPDGTVACLPCGGGNSCACPLPAALISESGARVCNPLPEGTDTCCDPDTIPVQFCPGPPGSNIACPRCGTKSCACPAEVVALGLTSANTTFCYHRIVPVRLCAGPAGSNIPCPDFCPGPAGSKIPCPECGSWKFGSSRCACP